MTAARVPTTDQVRALLAQGSGPNFAATSPAATDPRLRPRVLPLPPAAAADRVAGALAALRGWRLVGRSEGVIQATRTTRVIHFVDDISILLEPAVGGTAVSARSGSRIGRRDFGQNRRNLAELWRALGE
ncbi:MAG TPA: DUF1499 domain-containing protein [Gemmatimonadales bacterium]|nr:DUF1499 domain-containing protein [Gemmatimonadales bacterium]